jgi:hypothetical protein
MNQSDLIRRLLERPNATARHIQAELARLGIEVSVNYIRLVRWRKKRLKRSDERTSDRIRQMAQKLPDAKPADIRDALAAEGDKVDASYIKLVLWRERRKAAKAEIKPRRERRTPGEKNRSEAIRKILDADPTKSTAAIKAELEKQDVQVSANLIKVVRHHWRPKRRSAYSEAFKALFPDFPVGGGTDETTEAEDEE